MTSKKTIKSALESMLFVWGDPLPAKVAADLFNISLKETLEYFHDLQKEYDDQERGIMIREIDTAFQFCTRPENNDYIERLCTPVKEKRLSQSAMEVLAIIAYRQPVTKAEIESIRGIRCDRVIEGLMKKELIEETGRGTGIGRPILYGSTRKFLEIFGFKNVGELPDIEDIGAVVRDEDDEESRPGKFQQIAIDFKNS